MTTIFATMTSWFTPKLKQPEQNAETAATLVSELETRLRLILNSTADGIITIDAQGSVLSINAAVERMFGYSEDEMVGQNVKLLMPSPYVEEHDGYLERYHRTGEAHIIGQEREVEGKAKDGRVFPIALRVREMSSQIGKMYIGTLQDITVRKAEEAERALLLAKTAEDEARLRLILNSTADGIITIDAQGSVLSINAAVERMFGYSEDEMVGQNVKLLMPSPYVEEHDGYLERYHRTGEAHIIGQEREVEGKAKDGRVFPIALRVREMSSQTGKMYIGMLQDITARKAEEAERALLLAKTAEDEARLRLILNSTADGIITIDADGTVLSINAAVERMFGYDEGEIVRQNVKMLMPAPYKEEHDGYLERYHRTGEAHIIDKEREVEGKAKDGRVFPLALRVREMSSKTGKMYIGTVQDITVRKAEEGRAQVIETIREVVNRLTSASSEILTSSIQQSAAVQEQAASVAETMSTVDEITQMAQQSAERTRDVAEGSKKASEVGLGGQQVVAQSITGMKAVTESAGVAARSVTALAERAQAIGEIIASVNEIADQTNLLALNAAIEASRAGEHGRGFSIVATEVKALAEQSKKATAEVRKILGEIQRAMGGAVSSTTEVGKGITSTMDVVNQAGVAIDKLANLLTDASTAAAYVSASSSQQATGIAQINQAMQDINLGVTQISEATNQAKGAAEELNDLASKLNELLQRYDA